MLVPSYHIQMFLSKRRSPKAGVKLPELTRDPPRYSSANSNPSSDGRVSLNTSHRTPAVKRHTA